METQRFCEDVLLAVIVYSTTAAEIRYLKRIPPDEAESFFRNHGSEVCRNSWASSGSDSNADIARSLPSRATRDVPV